MTVLNFRDRRSWLHNFLSMRQHPIKILGYTSKTLWLLLIPIGKNLVTSNFDIQGWLKTYWLDLFVVLWIMLFAVFKWLFVFYKIGDGCITAHTGPFGVIKTTVYFSQISSIRVEQGIIARAFHASTLNLETQAKSITRSDIRLVISEKHINEIFELVAAKSENKPQFAVQPNNGLVVIYSVMFSSALSGFIIFGTLMWQVSRTVGAKMQDVATHMNSDLKKVDSMTLRLSESVPWIILVIAGVILFGWIVSFTSNLLNSWNFKAVRRGREQIMITSGKYKRNKQILSRELICYYDIRQSLLMKLARISSVHAQGSGFGRKKRATAAIIPMTKNNEMMGSFKLLEPELGSQRTQIRPAKGTVKSFVGIPLVISLIPLAAGLTAKQFVSGMDERINSFTVILTVPLVWYLVVQCFAYKATSVGITNDNCTLCYCPRYQFHKVIIPRKHISMVRLQQNPIQKLTGTCTLAVFTDYEIRRAHKVIRLPYRETRELLAQYIDASFLK